MSSISPSVLTFLPGCVFQQAVKPDALPYVPPVREQLADAPAEEVLLRGSEQPPASRAELLRAAMDQATPQEELLRAADTG